MSTLITFGNGGEFAGLTLAWRSIALQHLTDDIIFRQVGDFTENYSMAAQPPYPPYLDGHNIYVENPLGFKITLNPNTISYAFSHAVAPPPIGVGTITVDGLNIKCSHVALTANSILWGDIDIVYKNITIIGVYSEAMTGGVGISIRRRDYQTSKIFNCRIYGIPTGFILVDYIYNDDKKYLENCITYKCGVGLYLEGANVAGNSVNIKNSCFANSLNNDVVIVTNTNNIITNCADSDNSIASADATKSGNITGVTDADFISVDPDNADFLNIDQSSKLYENGTTPSAWNTADIRGWPRPHGGKLLTSIGAFEGIYSVPAGDYFYVENEVEILKGLVQSWTQTSTGRIPIMEMLNAHTANRNNPHHVALDQLYAGTLPEYADNAAAIAGGLAVGKLYRNGDFICVVH